MFSLVLCQSFLLLLYGQRGKSLAECYIIYVTLHSWVGNNHTRLSLLHTHELERVLVPLQPEIPEQLLQAVTFLIVIILHRTNSIDLWSLRCDLQDKDCEKVDAHEEEEKHREEDEAEEVESSHGQVLLGHAAAGGAGRHGGGYGRSRARRPTAAERRRHFRR